MKFKQLSVLEKDFPLVPLKESEIIERILGGEDFRIIDIHIARKNYRQFKQLFPDIQVYAAVKAHGAEGIIEMLHEEGSCFEVATIEELEFLIQKNISPKKILFTHPAKDSLEIKKSVALGVNKFVSDSEEDIRCLAKEAPHSFVLIRIATEDKFGNFNNDARFGANLQSARKLLPLAKQLKLQPYGLAFHVGVQTEQPAAWEGAIQSAATLFKEMKEQGIHMDTLDLGGGFPAQFDQIPKLPSYQKTINQALDKYFKDIPLKEKIIEPGMGISAVAGVTIGRVIHVKTSEQNKLKKLITVSTGKYSAGLLGIGLKIVFYSQDEQGNFSQVPEKDISTPCDFFGKVCSKMDTIFDIEKQAPSQIKSGDIIMFKGTGAYAGQIITNWCYKSNPTDLIFDSQKN